MWVRLPPPGPSFPHHSVVSMSLLVCLRRDHLPNAENFLRKCRSSISHLYRKPVPLCNSGHLKLSHYRPGGTIWRDRVGQFTKPVMLTSILALGVATPTQLSPSVPAGNTIGEGNAMESVWFVPTITFRIGVELV